MNYHNKNMVIKRLIETTLNSLRLLRIGELTPIVLSALTPVSKKTDSSSPGVLFRMSGYAKCNF